MGRSSRSPNFEKTPCVWSHGDGLGRKIDPTRNPPRRCLTKGDIQSLTEKEAKRLEQTTASSDTIENIMI
eukprot:9495177-Pyramimonas_sp.AAC.1